MLKRFLVITVRPPMLKRLVTTLIPVPKRFVVALTHALALGLGAIGISLAVIVINLATPGLALAQPYPAKPVRLIIPLSGW